MKKSALLILAATLALLWSLGGQTALAQKAAKPRVISLYAAHTELLLRLGARDNLVGVSGFETYQGPETDGWSPPPVFSIRDDVEKYLAAKPDLVLVRPMHMASGSRLVTALESAGIQVYSAQVVRAADLYQYWRDLARLVSRQAEAERLISDFDRRIVAYHQAAGRFQEEDKPGIFVEAIHNQIKTFTPDSLPVWLVELAGGRNVAADAKPQSPGLIIADYGPERLLAKADEVDIFISQQGPMNQATLKQIRERKVYQPLQAVKDGRIYKIDEDILARPTPSLLYGLEELAALTGLADLVPASERGPALSSPAAVDDPPAPDEEDEELDEDVGDLRVDLPPAK